MHIEMHKASSLHASPATTWDLAFTGETLDDRGAAALAYMRGNVREVRELRYQPDDLQITIGGTPTSADQIEGFLLAHKGRRILLEATTLGFVEVFLCCRSARQIGMQEIDFLYIEPQGYDRPRKSQVLHKRDFRLSGEVAGFSAIPGAVSIIDDADPPSILFFLGFEERRLDRALNEFSFRQEKCSMAFGVPAFQPGWEMDAFANNVQIIDDHGLRGPVEFCGAENPLAAYETIAKIHRTLRPADKLMVAPLGTKPHGIGTALYVAEHPDVGILYDHPTRHPGRSSNTFNWHLFQATF